MSDLQIKDYFRESNIIQSRVLVAMFLIVIMAGLLLARLYFVQVVQTERYVTLSRDNRINLRAVPPVRGRILDRNGRVLAENFTVYNLELTPDKIDDIDSVVDRVARLVQISDRDLVRFRRLLKKRPGFERQTLRTNLTESEAARFAANRQYFPGVELQARLQRRYPYKELTGHIVGYVGRISEADLDQIDRSAYSGTEYIGKLGIEATYEQSLLGEVGVERVETNAHGRIVRTLNRTPATAGDELHLTLDVQLQAAAEKALGDWRGAIVAIEPNTGDVLAMVSKPGYDPNPFVEGIDKKSYDLLRSSPDRPLLNRAFHGRYAPGSTIKPMMGLAIMEHGISPGAKVNDPGYFSLPNHSHRYRCWRKGGHGSMDLHDAIVQSCDVYFYRRARDMGIKRMHHYLTGLGLGVKTGIDLDGEPAGLIPDPDWKRRVHDQPWYPGETVIAGIGQGYVLATPLQLAASTAILAGRGRITKPRLVSAVTNHESGVRQELPVSAQMVQKITRAGSYDYVHKALFDVVHGKRGTARKIGNDSLYKIAGKTGTAQVIGIKQGEKYEEEKVQLKFRDHALFIAFAPAEDPQIALAVVAENGGGGSRTAAPIAREVMDSYLVDITKRYQRPEPEPEEGAEPEEAPLPSRGDATTREPAPVEPSA